MPQHDLTLKWSQNNTGAVEQIVNVTADAELNHDVSIPGASTNMLVACTLDVSQVKSIFMVSSRDLTLETNDGTTPADTITLEADKPLIWYDGCGLDNPLGTDVTAWYFTLAAGDAATFKSRILVDPTV